LIEKGYLGEAVREGEGGKTQFKEKGGEKRRESDRFWDTTRHRKLKKNGLPQQKERT